MWTYFFVNWRRTFAKYWWNLIDLFYVHRKKKMTIYFVDIRMKQITRCVSHVHIDGHQRERVKIEWKNKRTDVKIDRCDGVSSVSISSEFLRFARFVEHALKRTAHYYRLNEFLFLSQNTISFWTASHVPM